MNVQFSTDRERVQMNIHPTVLQHLITLLMTHPDLSGSGIGYSEFIADAIEAFEDGAWQAGRDSHGKPR